MHEMNDNKIAAYLRRIGYNGDLVPNYDTLHALQLQHLQTVPYENLDIMRGIPLSLKTEDIYDKVVTRGRGGYCFELNALFAWLLRSIGFEVTDLMARFLFREGDIIPMRRHRVLKVSIEGTDYLADVGVGIMTPRMPLTITNNHVSEQNGEKYLLQMEDFLGYVLYEWHKGTWRKLYSFTEEPQIEDDFIGISYYCETHPGSFFKTMDMVHIITDKGRKSIAGRELKLFTPEGVKAIVPANDKVFHELLHEHFGIKL